MSRLKKYASAALTAKNRAHYGLVVGACLVMGIPLQAQAQATGGASVSGLFSGAKTTMGNFVSLLGAAGVLVGIVAVFYAIMQMIKKGMGRGDDIEWRTILWPLIGGSLIAIVSYVFSALVNEHSGGTMGDVSGTTSAITGNGTGGF